MLQLVRRRNLAVRAVLRLVPSSHEYDGQKLLTRKTGHRLATPLFAVLILIEATGFVFAVDWVPAVRIHLRIPGRGGARTGVPGGCGLRSLAIEVVLPLTQFALRDVGVLHRVLAVTSAM
jgi:hypothetical protein